MENGVREWSLPTRHIGRRIRSFDCVDSTNTQAMALAGDAAHAGTVIVAERQTSGRGQYGRVWQCPPGSGILMSVLLFPPDPLRKPAIMTALAAVAVAETILEVTGLQAAIKWPNDLLMHGKKVCGVLIEQGAGIVIGIGLNINQSAQDFQELGLPDAASLALQSGRVLKASKVLESLIQCLDREYDCLLAGETTALESRWKRWMGLIGCFVTVEKTDGSTVPGHLREMAFDGLLLAADDGEHFRIRPESIRRIRAALGEDRHRETD